MPCAIILTKGGSPMANNTIKIHFDTLPRRRATNRVKPPIKPQVDIWTVKTNPMDAIRVARSALARMTA